MIDIDSLTLGELKRIAILFQNTQPQVPEAPHPFVGKYVICRCYSAGVHAGVLVSQTGDRAVLRESRRLWKWVAQLGIALSGVAQHGIVAGSKVDVATDIYLTGVIETIPCSVVAERSIREYK